MTAHSSPAARRWAGPSLVLALTAFSSLAQSPEQKLAEVRARRGAEVRALFAAAGVPYPAPQLFLRAHKQERELEVWAGLRGGQLQRVHVFPVCAASGGPGPKRQQGDEQVPEGFYRVDRFNPRSRFHLSLGLDYPNPLDRRRSGARPPGGDIFIHGSCVSIGCLAIEDHGIELLYLAALDTRTRHGTPVHVLVLPRRIGADGAEALQAQAGGDTELEALWSNLAELNAAFEAGHRVPDVRVDARAGRYRLVRAGPAAGR